jgi:UDP-perosamine 4-acetyltransferase
MDIRVVVLGAGDHGRVVFDILESEKRHFMVEGFIDLLHNTEIWGTTLASKPVFGGPDELPGLFRKGIEEAAVAIGDNALRRKYSREVERLGFQLVPVIHPKAAVSKTAYVGRGACICAGSVISIGARLGEGVIVNTGATIDHDCTLGDFVHVAPGAHLAGHVTVGDDAFIGMGAIIAHPHGQGITIGKGATVAAGSLVLKDVPDGATVAGSPAKRVRKRRTTKKKTTKKTTRKIKA